MLQTKTHSIGKAPYGLLLNMPVVILLKQWLWYKNTPLVAAIDVQDGDEISISADDDQVFLTEDKIRNIFQDTSSEEELETEWLLVNLQALQDELSSL